MELESKNPKKNTPMDTAVPNEAYKHAGTDSTDSADSSPTIQEKLDNRPFLGEAVPSREQKAIILKEPGVEPFSTSEKIFFQDYQKKLLNNDLRLLDPSLPARQDLPAQQNEGLQLGEGFAGEEKSSASMLPYIEATSGYSQDDIIESHRLSRKLGLPEPAVRENLLEVQKIDKAKTLETNKHIAEWVKQNPIYGPVAMADIISLENFGETLENLRYALKAPAIVGQILAGVVLQPFEELDATEEALANFLKAINLTDGQRTGVFGKISDFFLDKYRDLEKFNERHFPVPEKFQGRLIDNPQYLKRPEYWSYAFSDAFASFSAIVTMGYLTRNPRIAGAGLNTALASYYGGTLEGVALYSQLREDGVNRRDAFSAGIGHGLTTAVLEKISFDKIFKSGLKRGKIETITDFGVAGVTEALTEYLEEPSEAFFEGLAKGQSIEEIKENVKKSLENIDVMPGALSVGIFGRGIGRTTQRKAQVKKDMADMQAIEEAVDFANKFEEVYKRAKETKIGKESPELLKSFMSSMGADSKVYFQAQSIMELESRNYIIKAFNLDYGEVEALATLGQDIEMDLSDVLSAKIDEAEVEPLSKIIRQDKGAYSLEDVDHIRDSSKTSYDKKETRNDYVQKDLKRIEGLAKLESQSIEAISNIPGLKAQAEALAGSVESYVKDVSQMWGMVSNRLGVDIFDKVQVVQEAKEPVVKVGENEDLDGSLGDFPPQPSEEYRNAILKDIMDTPLLDREPRLRHIWGRLDGQSLVTSWPDAYREIVKNHGIGIFRKDGSPADILADEMVRDGIVPNEFTADDLVELLKRPREDFTLYQHSKKTAKVIDIDPSAIPVDLKDTKKLVEWVREQLQGKEVKIKDDGIIVLFTRRGIEASAKKRGKEQRQVYAELDKILEEAVFDRFIDADERHTRVKGQNIYHAVVRVSDELYSVRLKVDIKQGGIKPSYKDHKADKIEMVPDPFLAQSLKEASRSAWGTIRNVSIDVLKGEVKASKIEGGTLYQRSPETRQLDLGHRGALRIASDGYTILLSDKADLSTIFHESAHIFLEEMQGMERAGLADESLSSDISILKDWLEVPEGETLNVQQHEKFAKGFETYLMEGKAPSEKLLDVFRRFRDWLLNIYNDSKALGVELTDEVRGVFDRLMATEEEINNVSALYGLMEITNEQLDALGVTGPTRNYMSRLAKSAQDKTIEEWTVKKEQGRDARRREFKKEAEKNIENLKSYQVRSEILGKEFEDGTGPWLDVDMVHEFYGEDIAQKIKESVGPNAIRKNGANPETVALKYGYDSGHQMMEDISSSLSKKDIRDYLVRVKEHEYDSSFDSLSTLLSTDEALGQSELLGEYYAENIGKEALEQGAIKEIAQERIHSELMSKASSYSEYALDSSRSMQRERRAFAMGDIEGALEANYATRINMEFIRLGKEIDHRQKILENKVKSFAYMTQGGDPVARFAVMSIASKHGLMNHSAWIAEGKDFNMLTEWMKERSDAGHKIYLDGDILSKPNIPWPDLTVSEFQSLENNINQFILAGQNSRKAKPLGVKELV